MSTELKTLTQTEVETQKKDAKKILFDWADVENEKAISDVSKAQLKELRFISVKTLIMFKM